MPNIEHCDLSSLASVRVAASAVAPRYPKGIQCLINNAGVVGFAPSLTVDGYEMTFGTNVVGHFLLTELLLPSLIAGGTPPA